MAPRGSRAGCVVTRQLGQIAIRRLWVDPESGQRYVETPQAEWTMRLDEWRTDRRHWEKRLEPLARRAARRGSWTLYHRAKRAHYKRALPCPMPEGHVMFDLPDATVITV